MVQQVAQVMVVLVGLQLFLAVHLALSARVREREVVGDVVASDLPGRALRHAASVLLVLLGTAAVLADAASPGTVVPVLALALIAHEARPSPADRVLGTSGVRRGFHSRSFAELEEWRLLGDDLRFRLFGEWTAVPAPAERREDLLATLRREAGDRESEFNQ